MKMVSRHYRGRNPEPEPHISIVRGKTSLLPGRNLEQTQA